MGYAIEMFFDERAENKIRGYFKLLFDLGLSKTMYEIGTRPHISLAVYNEVDLNQLSKKIKEFLKDRKSINSYFSSIGVFPTEPSTVFLAPNFSEELRRIHHDYHNFMDEFTKSEWGYYLPNKWSPHCTIAIEVPKSNVANVIGEIMKDLNQFHFCIEKIGIVEFRPVKEIEVFSLKN